MTSSMMASRAEFGHKRIAANMNAPTMKNLVSGSTLASLPARSITPGPALTVCSKITDQPQWDAHKVLRGFDHKVRQQANPNVEGIVALRSWSVFVVSSHAHSSHCWHAVEYGQPPQLIADGDG